MSFATTPWNDESTPRSDELWSLNIKCNQWRINGAPAYSILLANSQAICGNLLSTVPMSKFQFRGGGSMSLPKETETKIPTATARTACKAFPNSPWVTLRDQLGAIFTNA